MISDLKYYLCICIETYSRDFHGSVVLTLICGEFLILFNFFCFFLIFYDFLRYCFQFFNGDKQHQRNQSTSAELLLSWILSPHNGMPNSLTGELPPHGYLPRIVAGIRCPKKSSRVALFPGLVHRCCQSKPKWVVLVQWKGEPTASII